MAAGSSENSGVDAGREPVAAVYAKALIGALEAAGRTEAVIDEFGSLIADCLDQLPQLDGPLASLRVSHREKLALLDKAFRDRMDPLLLNFLKVVSQHGRLDCLRPIYRASRRQLNELRGRIEVQVVTATELDAELTARITGVLQTALGRPVELTTKVESDLIGGLLVRVGDSVYDGSVVNRLAQLRTRALATAEQAIQASLERFARESA